MSEEEETSDLPFAIDGSTGSSGSELPSLIMNSSSSHSSDSSDSSLPYMLSETGNESEEGEGEEVMEADAEVQAQIDLSGLWSH